MTDGRPILVLIGAPAAGKSRLGKRIARLLDAPFIDTDKRIVARHGVIAEIFSEHGEGHFRALEREEVAAALREHAVVAVGGGAVMHLDTQHDLADHRVVLLTVSRQVVEARITGGKRPLVAGVDSWLALVESRRPVYERLATATYDTSHRHLDDVAADIVSWIKENDR